MSCASEALQWDRVPTSMRELLEGWLPSGCRDYVVKMLLLAGLLWTLWNVRNKMAIEGVFLQAPTDIIFKFDYFIPRWMLLLQASDRTTLNGLRAQVKGWVEFLDKVCDHPPTHTVL